MFYSKSFAAAALALLAAAAPAQTLTEGLREAFADVPQTVLTLEGGSGLHISYHSPASARALGMGGGTHGLTPGVLAFAMTGLGYLVQGAGLEEEAGWPEVIGTSPRFVEDVVIINAPPVFAYDMRFAPQGTAIMEPVLLSHGYERVRSQVGTYLRRGKDDFALDLDNLDLRNPFGGQIRQASRVAIEGDRLVYSSSTPVLLDVMWGAGEGLGEQAGFAAVLDALAATDLAGQHLLQAIVLSDPVVFRRPTMSEDLQAVIPEVPTLGQWTIGLLAEITDGETDTGLIALHFVSTEEAAAAATALPGTIEGYVSLRTREPIVRIFPARPEVTVSEAEPHVLILRLSEPIGPEANDLMRRTNFRLMQQMIYASDMGFLRTD